VKEIRVSRFHSLLAFEGVLTCKLKEIAAMKLKTTKWMLLIWEHLNWIVRS